MESKPCNQNRTTDLYEVYLVSVTAIYCKPIEFETWTFRKTSKRFETIATLFIALVGLGILQTTYYCYIYYCFETVSVASICAFNVVFLSRHPHQTEWYAVVMQLGRNIVRGKVRMGLSNAFVLISLRVTITILNWIIRIQLYFEPRRGKKGKSKCQSKRAEFGKQGHSPENMPASRELHLANPAGYFIAASKISCLLWYNAKTCSVWILNVL